MDDALVTVAVVMVIDGDMLVVAVGLGLSDVVFVIVVDLESA